MKFDATHLPFLFLLSITATSSSAFGSKLNTKSSKAQHCPPVTNNVTCGAVYNNSEVITLGGDLICNGNITLADGIKNAAISVIGKNTVLDCNGNSISQQTNSAGSAVDCNVFPSNSTERELMKKTCRLFYEFGIIVRDGATVKNCNVRKFYEGGDMRGGGTIRNSIFSMNKIGLQVANYENNTQYKVARSEFYNNYDGLTVYQEIKNGGVEILIEDVISKNNEDIGIGAVGTDISIRNVEARNNQFAGVLIYSSSSDQKTDITLDGHLSLKNNINGLYIGFGAMGTIQVTGNLEADRNKNNGVAMDNTTNVDVVLNKGSSSGKSSKGRSSGSIKACDNGGVDIGNNGTGVFEGNEYTCDTKRGEGNLPECTPCYPNCLS